MGASCETAGRYGTAAARWAGVGPYYAMFPAPFADAVVRKYSEPEDIVLDPFAGRGTAVFSAAAQGRCGVGVEINPVGFVYAKAKLRPARRERVERRLRELSDLKSSYRRDAAGLPPFFAACFCPAVRDFLSAARKELRWRKRAVDATVMALLLVHLHGKREASLSNQMRQAKSMSPDYAVRWWAERNLRPPELDPAAFMLKKLDWRYGRGAFRPGGSRIYLGDSTRVLPRLSRGDGAKLLLTSPPYFGLANYHHDQWLRLWLLGGEPSAHRVPQDKGGPHRGKFEHAARYGQLLTDVFTRAARLMDEAAVVYVRNGAQPATLDATRGALKSAFPRHRLTRTARPFGGPTQTHLFGGTGGGAGEVDLVLRPPHGRGRQLSSSIPPIFPTLTCR